MSTNPAEPLIAHETTTVRRPGRALVGWMPSDRGAAVLAGGRHDGAADQDLLARVEAARAAVAARPAGIAQDDIVDESDPSIEAVTQRLRSQPDTAAFWDEGWSVAVVDLAAERRRRAHLRAYLQLSGKTRRGHKPAGSQPHPRTVLPRPRAMHLPNVNRGRRRPTPTRGASACFALARVSLGASRGDLCRVAGPKVARDCRACGLCTRESSRWF